jgi:hypothetical protein
MTMTSQGQLHILVALPELQYGAHVEMRQSPTTITRSAGWGAALASSVIERIEQAPMIGFTI